MYSVLRLLGNTLSKRTTCHQEREFLRIWLRQRMAISKEVRRIVLVLQLGQTRQLVRTKYVLDGLVAPGIVDENSGLAVSSVRGVLWAYLGTIRVRCLLSCAVCGLVNELSLAITANILLARNVPKKKKRRRKVSIVDLTKSPWHLSMASRSHLQGQQQSPGCQRAPA